MKIKRLLYAIPLACLSLFSCEDGSYLPGDSLLRGDVSIEIDSTFVVTGRSIEYTTINSKSMTQLLGHLSVPEYGDLDCSFVSQLMAAGSLGIPDSIPTENVDSMRVRFRFANTAFTGDSLAPQQLKIYQLTKQLPSDIDNNFEPTGYYDPSNPIGVKSYTASHLGMNDEVFKGQYYGDNYNPTWERAIWVKLPKDFSTKVVTEYRTNPSTFQSPTSFAEYFAGIYVKPTFGKGLVVDITNTEVISYYHHTKRVTVVENNVPVTKDSVMVDSATLFCVSPEIVSSNNIKYRPSQSLKNRIDAGETIVVAPVGYNVEIDFPAQAILDKYTTAGFNMAVINDLTLSIPVENVKNDHGLMPPPYLLMVKTSEMDKFFADKKVPDGKNSFWAEYNSSTQCYNFTSMRQYILDLLHSGEAVSEEDCNFTLVPVWMTTEAQNAYESTTVVTKCTPFISRPTMGRLNLDKAKVKFMFSKQNLRY